MEPVPAVAEALQPVLEELRALEPLYHSAYAGATPEHYEKLVAPEFWEVGASGRRYSRAQALAVLCGRGRIPAAEEWQTGGWQVSALAADVYLLSYTLTQPGRVSRRATLWRRSAEGWQAVYHQGTVVQ